MASKKTLNTKNLEALGAAKLAELLMDISAENAAAKRRIRLELAGAQSPADVAREVRKRLATINRSRSFIDWPKLKEVVADLETQRRAIAGPIAQSDPSEALDLMWRFLMLASPIYERSDDRSGKIAECFHTACGDLGAISAAAGTDPETLADRAFAALCENNYGQYDDLIEVLAPVLGEPGLARLKARFVELANSPVEKPDDEQRQVIGWSASGPIYADDIARHRHSSTVRMALQDIAEAQGDVDAYIAQQSDRAKTVPAVAADIARRLLAAGRAEEAWTAINAVDENRRGWIPLEWEKTRLEVMEALGRREEAQTFRWACFEQSLSETHLRDYLSRLPDFDDVEAEERAIAHAAGYPAVDEALAFLVRWPALDKAAALVFERAAEIDGNSYEILTPTAEALADAHPLAATLLLRSMIDFSLDHGRTKRYRHAARHFLACEDLATAIEDFKTADTHATYSAGLQKKHGRKNAFWGLAS